MTRGRKPEPVPARLNRLSHDEGECRIWDGHLTDGYGRINIAGQFRLVHRVSYEIVRGPIPAGMEIDHTCFNRACIAVDHLRVATMYDTAEEAGLVAEAARFGAFRRGIRTMNEVEQLEAPDGSMLAAATVLVRAMGYQQAEATQEVMRLRENAFFRATAESLVIAYDIARGEGLFR